MNLKNKIKKVVFSLSLCAIVGIGMDVYAAPVSVTTSLPEKVDRGLINRYINDNTGLESKIYYATSSDSKYQLYCSDANNKQVMAEELTKGKKMEYGIAYILKNAYPTIAKINEVKGVNFDNSSETLVTTEDSNVMANTWITQAAIWGFQGSLNGVTSTSPMTYTSNGDAANEHSVTLYTTYTAAGEETNATLSPKNLWDNYVAQLISSAKNTKDPADTAMSITMSGKWTADGNNQKSGLVTINTTNSEAKYDTFAISLINAPTDVKVYTEAGTQVTDFNSIPTGTKIYFVVPNASSGKTFTLKANATITYDAAYQYVSAQNYQPAVLVGPETKNIAGELTIVPDTASSISTSIYFIGFIILLSGAGIIYANVKPRTQESE